MTLYIRKEFNQLTINGQTLAYEFDLEKLLPKKVMTVKWDGISGEVTYRDGKIESLTDIEEFQFLIDLYEEKKDWRPTPRIALEKKSELKSKFIAEAEKPVTFKKSKFNSNFNSMSILVTLINIAEILGEEEIDFFDDKRVLKSLTIEDAKKLLKLMNDKFKPLFVKKQKKLKELETVKTNGKEIEKLNWT